MAQEVLPMKIRTGQVTQPLRREPFNRRFIVRYHDPALAVERDAIARLLQLPYPISINSPEKDSP
jgi:hypothetical protein